MGVDIDADKEGSWIDFTFSDEAESFEQKIADRRKRIFAAGDDAAIKEMKDILANYQREKEKGDDTMEQ